MPRVTEVLDYSIPPYLAKWFKNNSAAKCEKIAEDTSKIGQAVDLLIQQDISEGGYVPPGDNEQLLNCLKGWEKFKLDCPLFVPSVKEMQVEIVDGNLVGHPDYICEEPGGGWGIADLKCTSGIRNKNFIQCAQYARMLMRTRDWGFPAFLRIIRLQRNSDLPEVVEIREKDTILFCMTMFEHYLGIFNGDLFFKEYFRMKLEDLTLGDF